MQPFSVFVAQFNPIVGDIAGNASRMRALYDEALAKGADLIAFPEMALLGYPPEDLVLFAHIQTQNQEAVQQLAACTKGKHTALLFGSMHHEDDTLYNAAYVCDDGQLTIRHKHRLPNHGVFDEKRYFSVGELPDVVPFRGVTLGIMNCEDMWDEAVAHHLASQGADYFIVLNASPFESGKDQTRKSIATALSKTHHTPLLYVNMVGGQDELVFDGGSFAVNAEGAVIAQAPYFEEGLFDVNDMHATIPDQHAALYQAMTVSLRDYVEKNGFSSVLIGLSGGIDSALTAVVAVDALGKDRVHCVMLPSPYTAGISLEDAKQLAENLGVRYDILPIAPAMEAIDTTLAPLAESPSPLALENIQSRLRGLTLMAISNSTGALLVTTGNKSEMAVGYATLYGDMCGAYSVLKDVYKTDVFELCRWRNTQRQLIPERIITRPPSAELRDNQKDEDSLPSYDILDGILKILIEGRGSVRDAIDAGYISDTVHRVASLLKRAEYKRRQAPPGVKLTSMSFGKDWRMPLTNKTS